MTTSRQLTILYGSQTGTAQDVAERIANQAKRRHFHITLSSMDEYQRENLITANVAIFVCATQGQGEEPDNMKKFWKFLLRKALPSDALSSLEYTGHYVNQLCPVIYARYNYAGKKLFKRLQQLGARPIFGKGEGDDQHYLGADGTLDPWLTGLWQVLMKKFPLPKGQSVIDDSELLPPKYRLIPVLPDAASNGTTKSLHHAGFIVGTLVRNERMTAVDHFQDVRHVSIQLPSVPYAPGDVVAVMPENDPVLVQQLIELMGWTSVADTLMRVESNDSDYQVPVNLRTPTSIRNILASHLSPWSTPRRSMFRLLSHFCLDEQQKEKLEEFDSAHGQEELLNYCHRPKRHCVEVIQDFFKVQNVPADYIFEIFPKMNAREYSIANYSAAASVLKQQTMMVMDLCVAMVEYKTKLASPRIGVCTRWLQNLNVGSLMQVRQVQGSFQLPKPKSNTPIICICPGTGIAPMRSIIHARLCVEESPYLSNGENYIFFGCRSKTADSLFNKELQHLQEKVNVPNRKLEVYHAYSRDQMTKVYVQHILTQHSSLVFDLIYKRNAYVYLSGTANQMPKDVKDALVTIVQVGGQLDRDQASEYMEMMKMSGRYQQETWS